MKLEPILKVSESSYTGDKPGTAQTAKLANNLMAAAALVITSEAVAMGVKGGVNAKVLIDIINASSGRNSASEDKFPRAVLPGTFDSVYHRPLLQGRAALRRRSRGHGRPDGLRLGGPADARHHQRQIWRLIRLHLDRKGAGGMGRRGDQGAMSSRGRRPRDLSGSRLKVPRCARDDSLQGASAAFMVSRSAVSTLPLVSGPSSTASTITRTEWCRSSSAWQSPSSGRPRSR